MTRPGGSSSATVLLPLMSAFLGGGRDSNLNYFQRSFRTTAAVRLSFLFLCFAISAAMAVADDSSDADSQSSDGKPRDAVKGLLNRSEVLYRFVKNVLNRVINQSENNRGTFRQDDSNDDEGSEEENLPMIHKGSCHCRAVCFELIAPQKILCKESQNGKIQYRNARIGAKSFRFIKGDHLVNMYYVNKSPSHPSTHNSSKTIEEIGAHSFCSQCGVHFLHAPNSHSTALDVNVDCLDPKDAKIKSSKEKVNLSGGIPVEDQWEQHTEINSHGYPATIAEEHSSVTTMPFNKSSPFAAYKNHPFMRHNFNQDWDLVDPQNIDESTIDLVFAGSDKTVPDTPTTVYTSQTEMLSTDGSPPTLTLDTRGYNDADSVVSLSSTKSGFPTLPSASSSLRTNPVSLQDSFFGLSLTPSNAAIMSPATTPSVRYQMNSYLRKHMMASSSSVSSTSSRVHQVTETLRRKSHVLPTDNI